MIEFKKDLNYNLFRQKNLGGNVSGIWKDNVFFLGSNSYPVPRYHYITSQFNNFEKNMFGDEGLKVNYHLSGYGINYNEALTSFLGESSERYAFTLLWQNLKKIIVTDSYKSLSKKYPKDKVLDLRLINVYFSSEDENNYITERDTIQWVPMQSLYSSNVSVFIPLQMIVLYDSKIFQNEKRFLNSAVSTGTASHESFIDSLKNSLIEIMQIDSYNLWWYGGAKGEKIQIELYEKISSWFNHKSVKDFLNCFDVKFTDISFDKSINVIVCEILSQEDNIKLPKYVVGVQGGLDREKCLYRSFFEALTVLEYSFTTVWNNTEKYKSIKNNLNELKIDNLDDNVIFYAKYGLQNLRKEKKYEFKKSAKVSSTKDLINSMRELSEYACYLDITPVEFLSKNMIITRVIAPELLPIALPSFPPYYHPRYNIIGGLSNNVPHPMA